MNQKVKINFWELERKSKEELQILVTEKYKKIFI